MNREYAKVLREVRIAERNFANAEPEYVEAACYALTAAREKLRAVIREQKRRC